MKTAFAILACILVLSQSFAATITAVQNGNWTAAATWDLNRVPADGDDIVIPAGRTVMFINAPYPQNNPVARPTLNISIWGTLDFSSPGNDKLYLDVGSKIQIYSGGKIQTTTSSTEIIAIYNGVTDNTVWNGTPSVINGPASATATSIGFSNSLLPIKLHSFEIIRLNENRARLIWVTDMEVNSAYFEIEFSDGNKSWTKIGKMNAAGNSTTQKSYFFDIDLREGVNQFRLKQVDIDNKFEYSQIVSLEGTAGEEKVYYSNESHEIILSTSKDVTVNIYNVAGSKLKSIHSQARIMYRPQNPGVYIIRVADKNRTVSKKVYMR